jgi:cyclophilin family peptidyl-prolyl cis-trans isomerase
LSTSARDKARRTGLLFEHLEVRSLLAANLMADVPLDAGDLCVAEPLDQQFGAADAGVTSSAQVAEGEGIAEGEDQPDLVAFAKALDQAGVKYYGGAWCAHCTEQKELFEDGADFVPFIEVTNPDRTLNQIGLDNNISSLPTWVFPDGTRIEGAQTLETISDRSEVAIPTSSTPSLAPIDDVTVLGGSPLHIPLDGYDPNGGPLTYTISVDGSVLTGELLDGNRSMRIDAGSYGDMVYQLFEGRAERPTDRIIELAEDDFYDGILFHRVIDGFMVQGGDPTGTGSGGSTLGDFDDHFHEELQHNRIGVLSYAKSGDDTNDSQFFTTLGPTRHLDFNHSVFGILVEGYHQLEAIGSTATGAGDRPTFDIAMNTVDIFTDTENGVLMLSAAEGATGSAEVTVTITDGDGNFSQQTFHVDVLPDTTANGGANGGPFLEDIDPITIGFNTPAQIQLSAIDVEGDAVFYDASASGSVAYTLDVNNETGVVTVTPPTGFEGEMEVLMGVRALNGSDTSDTFDQQRVTITVEGEATPLEKPTLDLLAESDSNIDTDNVTNVTNMTFRVANVADGAVVQILSGSTVIGQGTVSGTSIDITTNNLEALGDGGYSLTAVQSLNSEDSPASDVLDVTLDTTDPADFTSIAPTAGVVGHFLRYDVQHDDEGTTALTYSLDGAPSGATIVPETGVLDWTPTDAQPGENTFQVVGTDLAGNTVTQEVSIDVVDVTQWMQIRLEVQSLDGTVIDTISPGQDFWLRVYVQDVRTENADGVFAAYLDVNYDSAFVSVNGEDRDDIVYGDEYQNGKSGSLTTPGLMDEVGAFGPTSSLDGTERLLLMVSMTADEEGVVQFYGDPGDAIGSDALVFGFNEPLDWDLVTILPTTLTVAGGITAKDDLYNVDEDSDDNSLPVLDNDENELTGDLIITAVGATNHGGTVTIAGDGQSVIYTPAADYFGEEEFTYTIGLDGAESTATVTVQVFPVNDAPTANDDDFEVATDSDDNFLNVLGNDEIAPDTNETIRVSEVGTPAHGTVQIAPNGTHLLYTPDAGYAGEDTFTYTIIDGTGADALTSEATITVTTTDLPSPTAGDDTATVLEDSDATEIDVLSNDTPDQTGADLTIENVSTPASGGQVTIIDNGQKVTYKPSADFQGTDIFTYIVRETDGGTTTATVTVTVTPVNDPPTANDDEFNVSIDGGTETLDVLDNDSLLPDTDGELVITEVTQGSGGGTVSIAEGGGSILYTPEAGFEGTETFTYTLDDGSGETATATVTVDVLKYVPRDISGDALLYGANGLGGLDLSLAGTDDFDEDVLRTAESRTDGSFSFAGIAPGTYEISRDSSVFLLDGDVMRITVESAMDDDDDTGSTFDAPGRKAKFLTIADLLVTAPKQSPLSPEYSVTVAVEPGVGDHWYSVDAGWEEYVSGGFELSADLGELTVSAVDDAGVEFVGTVDTSDVSMVKWLGEENGVYLLRLDATPDEIGLEVVGGSGEAEGEGEGSAATRSIVSAASTPEVVDDSTTADVAIDGEGEGEGEAAPSLASSTVNTLQVTSQPAVSELTDLVSDVTDTTSTVGSRAAATTPTPSTWTEGASTPVSTTASGNALAAVDAAVVEEAFRPVAEPSVVDDIAESDASDDREIVIDTIFAEDSLFVSV